MNKRNIIKQALHKDIPQWDKEGTWMEIDKQLHPKKNRRRIIFFIFFLGTATLAGLFTMASNSNSVDNVAIPSAGHIVHDDAVKSVHSDEPAIDNISKIETEELSIFEDENNLSQNTGSVSLNSHSLTPSSMIENEPLGSKSEYDQDDLDENMKIVGMEDNSSISQFIMEDKNSHHLTDFISFEEDGADKSLEEKLLVLPLLTTLTFDKISTEMTSLPIDVSMVDVTPKSTKWSTSLMASYSWVNRHLKSTDPLASSFIDIQNEKVSPKEALDISWTIQRQVTKKLQFSSGIRLIQINEFLAADDVYISQGSVEDNQAYVIHTVAGNEYLSGNREFEHRSGYAIKSPNKFHRIDLPLSVITQWQVLGRTLSLGAGIDINVYQKFTGINVGPEGSFIYKDPKVFSTIYKKRWMNSWHLNLQLDVWESDLFTGFIGVDFNKDWNTTIKSTWNIDQKYTWYGVNMGCRYHW